MFAFVLGTSRHVRPLARQKRTKAKMNCMNCRPTQAANGWARKVNLRQRQQWREGSAPDAQRSSWAKTGHNCHLGRFAWSLVALTLFSLTEATNVLVLYADDPRDLNSTGQLAAAVQKGAVDAGASSVRCVRVEGKQLDEKCCSQP
jgi:hypothetical protein